MFTKHPKPHWLIPIGPRSTRMAAPATTASTRRQRMGAIAMSRSRRTTYLRCHAMASQYPHNHRLHLVRAEPRRGAFQRAAYEQVGGYDSTL